MQKQARVTPRNIQFQDNVQIRQIPGNEDQGQGFNRQPSWDPNLKNKGIFDDKPKKQKKAVIGIVIGGAVLLAIVIGAVVGAVVSQKSSTAADNSLSYNEACNPGSSQCMSSKNLYCPNGFCVCTSSLTWNSTANSCSYLKYNDGCTSSSQCDSSLQLVCTNSLCKCNAYYTYNTTNSSCTLILNNTLTYGDTCAVGSAQCKSSAGLACNGTCSCTATKAWNVSACSCPSATFLNSSSLCETQRKVNETCVVGSAQCDSARGLSCNNSRCVCGADSFWDWNFERCYLRRNYSDTCAYDNDCIPTLICPPVAGYCNCSQYLPDYTCNCANNKYYDATLNQCVSRASFGGSCTTSLHYTCLISLQCPSGTCTCPSGTSWNATGTACQ
ncbi:hypothetical protein I4U23_012432 [Adineta vaga]|nr:hypothetical protein I4U23_012432 [Adineta vaga]